MNWKNDLEDCEHTKNWNIAIELITKIIDRNTQELEFYVRAIYFLHNTLVEENYNDSQHDIMAQLLLRCFTFSKSRFSDNSEYLFFIGNILYVADWYFGIDDDFKPIEKKTAFRMQKKAFEQDPNNILFEWGYRNAMFDPYSISLALKIFEDKKILGWLKSKGFPGKRILHSILLSKDRA